MPRAPLTDQQSLRKGSVPEWSVGAMTAVTQNDLSTALNTLRSEVPSLVQPALFTLRQEVSYSLKSLNGRAIEEIAGQVRALAENVDEQQA